MSGTDLRHRYPIQYGKVRAVIAASTPIEHEWEIFERNLIVWRTPRQGLVAVGEEFLNDTRPAEIFDILEGWDIARRIKSLKEGERILITDSGIVPWPK